MLDVHPPHHATHTWRDFFVHIATITVGLLIAIGLEQTVEYFHRRHELQKARQELRDEVQRDRVAVVVQIQSIHQVQSELDADLTLLLAHRATGKPLAGPLRFDWNFRRLPAAAWKTNTVSGALTLMPHSELGLYDYIFTVGDVDMAAAGEWELELETANAIAHRSPGGGELSTQDTNELITAISATQGKLARNVRLIAFLQTALDDHNLDR